MNRIGLLLGAAVALAMAQPGLAAPAAAGNETTPAAQQEKAAEQGKPEKATSIPEPDTLALFLLGAAGLVLGRRLSRSKRRSPES